MTVGTGIADRHIQAASRRRFISAMLADISKRLDDGGKVERGVVHRKIFVQFARVAAERGGRARDLRRLHRQSQILEHQRGGKTALIAVVGGGGGADAGNRAIARHRPVLAR